LLLLGVFMALFVSGEMELHYASTFGSVGDKWMGGPSPCLRRMVRPTDRIIAHRRLPCGTKVLLLNPRNGKTTQARVGERGPYGACTKRSWKLGTPCPKGYWRVKRKSSERGVWRGAFDLTPAVSKSLGKKGIEPILLMVLERPQKRKSSAKRYRPNS
jgi:hypothetical protein